MCDHVMIISHGRLVASDSPEGLQRLMSGTGELKLTVKGSFEVLREAVDGMTGIQDLEQQSGAPEGCCNVRIRTEGDQDVREALFYLLAEKKLPILSMTLTEKSLEDIFLEVTGGAAEAVEPEAEEPGGKLRRRRGKKSLKGQEES